MQYDYSYIDSVSKLVTILLRTMVKFNRNELLDRIFDAFLLVLEKNYDAKNNLQRPFFRFLFNIIYDLKRPEYAFQPKEIQELFKVFIKLFVALQPLRFPNFAFVWLELISNKLFLQSILSCQDVWNEYHLLFLALFKFFKQNQELMNTPCM